MSGNKAFLILINGNNNNLIVIAMYQIKINS